jgi:two-component system response regulator HydG
MVVQDTDGILGQDDLQEGDNLGRLSSEENHAVSPASLVGRPLTEVERYFTEQALAVTNGNRVEAAKMLGIGERTLYRVMQDWKLQDRIKEAMTQAGGDHEAAAKLLDMKPAGLERKLKKWGLQIASASESEPGA